MLFTASMEEKLLKIFLEINQENDFMKISGYIGKAIISKGNRTFENYFINGRYIKSNIISKAIEDGYKFLFNAAQISIYGN